jgi:hypothetical protein
MARGAENQLRLVMVPGVTTEKLHGAKTLAGSSWPRRQLLPSYPMSWGTPQDRLVKGASFERPHGTYFPKYRDSRVWTVHVDGSTDLGW